MVFRGYEVMFRFGKLLAQYGDKLATHLGSRQSKLFTDFDIQPVITRNSGTPDYMENKKLYFLKWEDGAMKGVY